MITVITIDGPASSGKGTVAKILAAQLGFAYLESGAIYRALGWWVNKHYPDQQVSEPQVLALIASMQLEFKAGLIWLNNQDVTEQLRAESIGMLASKYSAIAEVRARLLQFQRDFAQAPGLVTDGRDMGSVVFPNANLKVFLTASAEKRAERRYKQLHQFDKAVTMGAILQDIITRDEQDSQRSVAPLSYDSSYRVLDNSELSIDETISLIRAWL
jgi:CMP/dCMP kinase